MDNIKGVWSRVGTGNYRYTKQGAFPNKNKIDVIFSHNAFQAPKVGVYAQWVDANTIQVNSVTFSAFNSGVVSPSDSILNAQRIEIRVYN